MIGCATDDPPHRRPSRTAGTPRPPARSRTSPPDGPAALTQSKPITAISARGSDGQRYRRAARRPGARHSPATA